MYYTLGTHSIKYYHPPGLSRFSSGLEVCRVFWTAVVLNEELGEELCCGAVVSFEGGVMRMVVAYAFVLLSLVPGLWDVMYN